MVDKIIIMVVFWIFCGLFSYFVLRPQIEESGLKEVVRTRFFVDGEVVASVAGEGNISGCADKPVVKEYIFNDGSYIKVRDPNWALGCSMGVATR